MEEEMSEGFRRFLDTEHLKEIIICLEDNIADIDIYLPDMSKIAKCASGYVHDEEERECLEAAAAKFETIEREWEEFKRTYSERFSDIIYNAEEYLDEHSDGSWNYVEGDEE